MILLNVQNPMDLTLWTVPRALQKVTVPDQRREALSEVIGGDDALDMYGNNPNPRATKTVKVTFRVTPRFRGTTFDALRKDLNRHVDHGLWQRLRFLDDDGLTWDGMGKLVNKDLDADNNQQWQADWTLEWRLQKSLLESASSDTYQWGGTGLTWGQTGLHWGDSPYQFALGSSDVTFTLHNPTADAETRDMRFTLSGRWGPAAPDGTRDGPHITIINLDVIDPNTNQPVQFYICDTMLSSGTSFAVDIGAVGITKSGQPSWGVLKRPDKQFGYMRFRVGDNRLHFRIEQGAYPNPVVATSALSALAGICRIRWAAKKSAS